MYNQGQSSKWTDPRKMIESYMSVSITATNRFYIRNLVLQFGMEPVVTGSLDARWPVRSAETGFSGQSAWSAGDVSAGLITTLEFNNK